MPIKGTSSPRSALKRSAWLMRCSGDPFGGGLGDLFDAFFNGGGGGAAGGRGRRTGPMPGPDAEMVLRLTFREAIFGVHREITVQTPIHCDTCEGTGAEPGTSVTRCPECQGAGELRRVRQSILGQVITAVPCNRCQGSGQFIASPCHDCGGDGRRTAERTVRPSGSPVTDRPGSEAVPTGPSLSIWRSSPTPSSSGRMSTSTPRSGWP
jgi:DnaJ-class molecular chaperone